jgi:acetoin utilization deacetylase AcuC-like enzyme
VPCRAHASLRRFNGDPSQAGNGFCLVNNVAVAAAYAMSFHRDWVQRVAIVDIDVHHGNGTEDIVRNLFPRKLSSVTRTPGGVLNVTQDVYAPWRDETDADNVQFISIHGWGARDDTEHHATFYPGTGSADDNVIKQVCFHRASLCGVEY